MMDIFASLPAFCEPLAFGVLGTVLTLTGSVLRTTLTPVRRTIGGCCCCFGLALMFMGFIRITGTSVLSG